MSTVHVVTKHVVYDLEHGEYEARLIGVFADEAEAEQVAAAAGWGAGVTEIELGVVVDIDLTK